MAGTFDMEFDVVVAGGGSAGCVLATRLTENPAITVCLIEAGPDLSWLSERAIPRFFPVAEPRRRILERLAYDLYSAEVTGW